MGDDLRICVAVEEEERGGGVNVGAYFAALHSSGAFVGCLLLLAHCPAVVMLVSPRPAECLRFLYALARSMLPLYSKSRSAKRQMANMISKSGSRMQGRPRPAAMTRERRSSCPLLTKSWRSRAPRRSHLLHLHCFRTSPSASPSAPPPL